MEDNTLIQEYLWTCSYLNEHGRWINSIFYAASEAEARRKIEKLQRETGKTVMTIQITQHPQGLVFNEIVYPGIILYVRKKDPHAPEARHRE